MSEGSHQAAASLPAGSPRLAGGFIPNFVIAGAPKCGTSSLHRWLAAHPDAMGSSEKETYFLSDPGTHMFRPKASILNGLAGYTRYFERDTGQNPAVVLESTPSYLYSQTALRELPLLASRPKVVFVLREPARQVFSLFRYFQTNWNWIPPDMTFRAFVDRAIAGDPPDFRGNELARNAIPNARFVRFLRDWRQALGEDRMRVYLFEDLKKDPRRFTETVAAFAGLDPAFFRSFDFRAHNQTIAVRSRRIHDLVIAVRGRVPKGPWYEAARKLYHRFNTRPAAPTMSSEAATLQELKAHFREDNRLLSKEFGLDLSAWT